MKKTVWLALILILLCVFALSACDNSNTPPNNDNFQQTTAENGDGNSPENPTVCQHTFGDWNTVKQPTCKEEGKRTRTCSTCSEVEEDTIPKNEDHTPVTDTAVAATCKDTGLTEGSHCSVCNKVLVEQAVVPKTEDHTPVIDAAVPATCKDTGLTEGSHCSVCNEVLVAQTVVPKTEDHTTVTEVAVPATCKNTGLTEGSHCSVCNEVLVAQTVVPKTEDHTTVTDVAVPATCKNTGLTEGSHCSVCNKVLVEQETVSKLKHVYDLKKTDIEYIRTKATTSASATYYYSCICGSKGTAYFSYGSPISDNSGWTSCNKTVYGIAQTYFYTKANSTSVCGRCKVGYAIQVVSTNGEWYKVSESNVYTNCAAYIKCSDVTDDSSMATFVKVPEEYSVDASVKSQYTGAYLRNDISGSNASKVGLIEEGYITVASVNRSKTWAAVYYFGTDSEGRTYDGSKLYYCSLKEIEVLGLPDNWP